MKNANKKTLAGYDPKKVKLSRDEQEFEDNLVIADYSSKSSKSERMNIRLPEEDLLKLQKLALKHGLPYQTLVGSVIHRYVTDQLVDLEEAKKILAAPPAKKRA
ncbi:MAG: hypothetical protein KA715_13565 [Xanthomonadaceae bacterium]|nr:hypothetical protein [Xanthomonadaceae bacterium]